MAIELFDGEIGWWGLGCVLKGPKPRRQATQRQVVSGPTAARPLLPTTNCCPPATPPTADPGWQPKPPVTCCRQGADEGVCSRKIVYQTEGITLQYHWSCYIHPLHLWVAVWWWWQVQSWRESEKQKKNGHVRLITHFCSGMQCPARQRQARLADSESTRSSQGWRDMQAEIHDRSTINLTFCLVLHCSRSKQGTACRHRHINPPGTNNS